MKHFFRALFLFVCLSVMIVMLFPINARATNGMQAIGVGAEMRSMGGAGSALSLGASVITVNPAAISELEGRIDFGMTLLMSSSKYKSTDAMAGATPGFLDSNTSPGAMPAFGLVIPVDEKLTFGLGAYGVAGMGVDYGKGLYGGAVYSSFEMMKFIPALSYQLNERVSIGGALNFDYAALGFEAGGKHYNKNSQYGYGFQLGIFGRLTDAFSVSLAYISKQEFPDFEFYGANGKDRLAFDLPQQVAAGFGYTVSPRLKIAVDIKWIDWSNTMGAHLPEWKANLNSASPWNCDWDDQMVYAIGVEFALNERFRVRAGYNYGQSPLPPGQACEAIAFPAIQEQHYTVGFGWDMTDRATLNMGFMYAPENSMSGANSDQFITSYDTALKMSSIEVGLSYKF